MGIARTRQALDKKKRERAKEDKALLSFNGPFAASMRYRGPIEGHVFRIGEKGTGYYHDSAVKPEEVRGQEHDELGKPTGNDTELPGTTRCTRARNAAGIRIRKKNTGNGLKARRAPSASQPKRS